MQTFLEETKADEKVQGFHQRSWYLSKTIKIFRRTWCAYPALLLNLESRIGHEIFFWIPSRILIWILTPNKLYSGGHVVLVLHRHHHHHHHHHHHQHLLTGGHGVLILHGHRRKSLSFCWGLRQPTMLPGEHRWQGFLFVFVFVFAFVFVFGLQ